MSELIPFDFQDSVIRAVLVDGEPHLVAKDVAVALGYSNAADAITRHCKGVAKRYPLMTAGGMQEARVIAESDVMRLIVSSRLPAAEAFERKVFEEILPQIRKTGSYGVAPALTGPALYLAAIEQATAEIAALESKNRALTPKAEAFDGFLGTSGDYSLNEGAKLLARNGVKHMGQNRLRDLLLSWGWIYRGRKDRLRAKQSHIDLGRMNERTSWYYDDETGERKAGQNQAVITAKGLFDVKKRLAAETGLLVVEGEATA